ncbi:MAG: hypothetical protein U0Z53_20855 [Blastocatellia bacterium]
MILTQTGIHSVSRRSRRHEQGYAMIALLAAMTISLIFIAAALPSLKHNMQREREEEMFYRGEQIATAIMLFQQDNRQPPTSLAQLTEYNPLTKKRYLRASALRDPLTLKGEWRLVRAGDPALKELALAYMKAMKMQDPRQLPQVLQAALITPGGLPLDTGTGDSQDAKKDGEPQLGSEAGPIVGVASKSKDQIIRNYYGIETYDKGVIVAGVATPNQMIAPGIPLVAGIGTATTTKTPTDPRCPKGGIPFEIDGKIVCTGYLYPGQCPPTDERCRPKGDGPKP